MQDLVVLIESGMERAVHEGCVDQDEYDAWQTLKSAVLAQQTNNTGSPKFCPHWQVYNRGGSGEFSACDCNGDLERAKLRASA